MRCPGCSAELPDTAKFCPHCGFKIAAAPAAPVAPKPAEAPVDSGLKKSVFSKSGSRGAKGLDEMQEKVSGKEMLKLIWIGVLGLLIVIAVVAFLVTKSKRDKIEAERVAKEAKRSEQVLPLAQPVQQAVQQPSGAQPPPAPAEQVGEKKK